MTCIAENLKSELLVNTKREANPKASNATKRAVNQSRALRNWAIGCYIVEYEQGGSDKIKYDTNLFKNLEKQIDENSINVPLFKGRRQFYIMYLQIGVTVSRLFVLSMIPMILKHFFHLKTNADTLLNNSFFSHIREIMVVGKRIYSMYLERKRIKRPIKTNLYL